MWSGSIKNRFNVVIECQICNKSDHIAVNCFHRNSNTSSTSFLLECQICGKRGHVALECFHRINYAFQGPPPPVTLNAMVAQQTLQYVKQDSWIVDVWAFHHITADVNAFNQVAPFESSKKITIGNGIGLTINNIGSTILKHNFHELIRNNLLHTRTTICADNHS